MTTALIAGLWTYFLYVRRRVGSSTSSRSRSGGGAIRIRWPSTRTSSSR